MNCRNLDHMGAQERLQLVFTDPNRVWQDLVVPAERTDGRVFVPHERVLEAGRTVVLRLSIEGKGALEVEAVVERSRRPSMRFSRGVFLRLSDGSLQAIRDAAGSEAPGSPSLGRAEPRYDLNWQVAFRTPALPKPLVTRDISAEGMHIQMPERVRRGHVLEFILHTPQGHELLLKGEVQWTSELIDRVGVRFLFEEDGSRSLLGHLIETAAGSGRRVPEGTVLVVGSGPDAVGIEAALVARWPDAVARLNAGQALAEIRRSRPRVVFVPRGIAAKPLATSLKLDAELRDIRVLVFGPHDGLEDEAMLLGASGYVATPAPDDLVVAMVDHHLT